MPMSRLAILVAQKSNMKKKLIHFRNIGHVFSLECRGRGVSNGETLNSIKTDDFKQVTCNHCLKSLGLPRRHTSGDYAEYSRYLKAGGALPFAQWITYPKQGICRGSCGERVPQEVMVHGGKLTESTRTVIHHPHGMCHHISNLPCIECDY